jgi:subtilase family serine protease
LAAAASSAGSTSLTIPVGTAPGSYYVIARSDADGGVTEANETNNTASSAIVIGPDLFVSAFTAPATGGAGAAISVSSTTKNQGGGSTGAASTTRFSLSTDAIYDAGDTPLGLRAIAILAAGASSAGSTSLTIPVGTAPGNYYVLARADADGAVFETNETNNTASSAIAIGPDLVVSALTDPTSVQVGHSINMSSTTKNQGGGSAGASTTKFYLSTDAIYDTGDTQLGLRAIAVLAAGASSAGSTTLTVPVGTPPGNYYLIAVADATSAVLEANEANNTLAKTATITP